MNNSLIDRINPQLSLIISRALAALRPSLIAFLVANGERLSGGVEIPISFCNVLFVGNLCASIAVGIWFGFDKIWAELKTIDRQTMIGLFINGCLASLLSALIFTGLRYTSVTNSVLLGRLGPVLFAIAGTILLGKKVTNLEWAGFGLIFVGVFGIVLKENMYQINKGDLLIIASAIVYAIQSLGGKLIFAEKCSLKVVVFSRNFVSSIVFFIIATWRYGLHHFSDVFSGQLWIVMSIYAIFIIVIAQFLWFVSLNKLDSQTVGKLTIISPIFGVIYAFLLNGERPSSTQLIAFIVTTIGVFIASIGKKSPTKKETQIEKNPEMECTASAS